jgi:signal peptidase II
MQSKHLKISTVTFIVILILLLDQTLKIWIKTHLQLHESIHIFSWFQLYFTENPGMAFGMEIMNKWLLSGLRIVAVAAIAYYIAKLIKRDAPLGYLLCIALIFAGALGNIIDCVFYGVIFDHSYGQIATFLPENGGYATFLQGKVVDMLSFPLIHATYPEWVPRWGGEEFVFFRPIFNVADSAICVGVATLLLFYRKMLAEGLK